MFKRKIDATAFEILKSSMASISIKVFGMGAAFGVSVFLGRTVGPLGLGTINLANQIVTVCSVFAMFGMQHVLIKKIAIAFEKKQWATIKDSIDTSILFNGGFSLLLSTLGILFAENIALNLFNDPSLVMPLVVFFISLFPLTLTRVLIYSLNGIKKIWQSNLLDQVLSISIVALVLLVILLFDLDVSVNLIGYIYLAARVLVFICTTVYWKKNFKFSIFTMQILNLKKC